MRTMRLKVKRKWRLLGVLVLLAVLVAVGANLVRLSSYRSAIEAIEIGEIDLSQVPDGVYVGYTDAHLVSAEVRVTVEDNLIVDIGLDHKHGRGEAAEAIVEMVKSAQSLNVDFISGATSSSRVILKAIENALTAE